MVNEFMRFMGLTLFRTVSVDHCPFAYAIVMAHSDGWKLVYVMNLDSCNFLVQIFWRYAAVGGA